MNNPLVTVVVPVYNVEKYLDRCIDSIVNQTYKNLEIILVDDGSPDNCPQMCDGWAKRDGRIKVIHKENAGLGMARNSGIELAKGDYILFVDSDDYIDLSTVEKCVAELIKTNADVVMFGRFNVLPEGNIKEKPIMTNQYVFSGDSVINDILPGMFTYARGTGVSSCCKMYSLNTIKKSNIKYKSEREIISEDAFFVLELFKYVKRVAIIPESFYYYCQNSDSLTTSYKKDRQEKNNSFLLKSLQKIKNNNYPDCVVNALKIRYHAYTISALKQILNSDLTDSEKKEEVYKTFKDRTLNETLSSDVLSVEKKTLKIFYYLVRYKMYGLAFLMLRIRVK